MTGVSDIAWALDAANESSEKRTRKERIATAVLAGALANPGYRGTAEDNALSAVLIAEALIEVLDARAKA